MERRTVIAIGRQYGSGGREIGRKLASRLGIPFYDKELLAIAAKDSGLSEELFRSADEKPASSYLYSLMTGTCSIPSGSIAASEMPLNDQLFLLLSNTVKRITRDSSAVIIGRCADYVLRKDPDLVSVFIHAPIAERVGRVMRIHGIDEAQAEDACIRHDRMRSNFHDYYSDSKWGRASTYDLSIESSKLGIDGSVELILRYLEIAKGGSR